MDFILLKRSMFIASESCGTSTKNNSFTSNAVNIYKVAQKYMHVQLETQSPKKKQNLLRKRATNPKGKTTNNAH